MIITYFSKAKSDNQPNEDCIGYNQTTVMLVDGATDKSGKLYNGARGGELIAKRLVRETLSHNLTGSNLIERMNLATAHLHQEVGVDTSVKYNLFGASAVVARKIGDETIITVLGECGYRINGEETYTSVRQVDALNAAKRAQYIKNNLIQDANEVELKKILTEARTHIQQDLLKQFDYQNDPKHNLGFGVIDGTCVPEKFIHTRTLPTSSIDTLELFSDGYWEIPTKVSVEAWEAAHQEVERLDPHKYKQYKATKPRDDRTVIVVKNWSEYRIE